MNSKDLGLDSNDMPRYPTYAVETTKNTSAKSGYESRYRTFFEKQAWMWYQAMNIGKGYKKRLVLYNLDGTKKILDRRTS